jgi:hypothetical protein
VRQVTKTIAAAVVVEVPFKQGIDRRREPRARLRESFKTVADRA